MWAAQKYVEGDYVALLSNDFIMDDFTNILGKINVDGSRNIGKVIGNQDRCVVVQYGGEKRKGEYDPITLGFVLVRIHPDTANKSGVLGSNPKKVGIIVDWDNFQKGNSVTVRSGNAEKTYQTSIYDPSDLIFEITTVRTVPTEYFAIQTAGSVKRKTIRRNRIKRYLTRVINRV